MPHRVENKTEAANARGDLFAKRVRLMDDWAKLCALPLRTATVSTLHGAKATA